MKERKTKSLPPEEKKDGPTSTGIKDTKTVPPSAEIGQEVMGNYRIIQKLGEGGMGEVYEAEQVEPIRRRVALKIIKWGMDTNQVVARFESERQALALMDHPSIAKVFDAGATEAGRPFFVMECVKGVPITEYCDTNRLNNRQRLELFTQVCEGIQHAHQKGIIHRDIKASNVLVTFQDDRPVPKIIDFGVAKAISQRLTERTMFTEMGQLIGTPEYMSPEQAEMTGLDVDTRTDVYSLGVLMYELLVGVLPFGSDELRSAGFDEIRRRIREQEPPKPSTRLTTPGFDTDHAIKSRQTDLSALAKQLKGELDWITMKAMAKDRTQRYASASELAADVMRYLKHEPVIAGPPSAMYRLRKYVRRHKAGVAAAAVVVLALLVGVTGATVGLIRARKAEQIAKAEAAKANAINQFLQDTLSSANPIEGSDRDITVLEALEQAADEIPQSFKDQPEVEAELKHNIGITYLRLGHYDEAEELLTSSLNMWQEIRGANHPDLAAPLTSLAVLKHEQGNYEDAEKLYREALSIKRKQHGEEHEDVMNILNNLALVLQDKGDLAAAEQHFRKILEIDRKIWGENHLYVAIDLNNLGRLLKEKRAYQEAEPFLREAVEILKKEQHPWLSISLGNLGELLAEKGDYMNAEPMFVEAVTLGERKLGRENQDVAKLRTKYGFCLINLENLEKAEEQLLLALPVLRNSLGEQNEWTQKTIRYLVELYKVWGKEEIAEEYEKFLISRQK
jgi:serine/threonine protein kinase